MAEKIKVVNGHVIKAMDRNEINKELKNNGDWSIDYYIPGRMFNHLFFTINRKRYRFNTLEQIETVCKTYTRDILKDMNESEIQNSIRKVLCP